jgi:hypothetical protein
MRLTWCEADAGCIGQGVHCRAGSGQGWAATMGTIVKFPDDGRIVRFGRTETPEESATVIILPVVRVERHDEGVEDASPRTHPPADNGGRRRMRRR